MHELIDPLGNPVTYAIPFFVLTILMGSRRSGGSTTTTT